MPSRPLSPDRQVTTALHTRVDVEAIDIAHGRTDRKAAAPRLALLVPPTRTDLVDEVLYRFGRRRRTAMRWPPYQLVCELAAKVKAVHLGEVKLRGPAGETVEVVAYVDKMRIDRRMYRLRKNGVWVGDYKTTDELGKHVDLAELVEDDGESDQLF